MLMLMQCNQERYFPAKNRSFQTSLDYIETLPTYPITYNLTVGHSQHFTRDKEEARWDYFREDPLLHIFFSIFHKVNFDSTLQFMEFTHEDLASQ